MHTKTISTMKRFRYFILSLIFLPATAFAEKPDTVNIENVNVASYLKSVVYTETKQKSTINQYLDGINEKRLDHPNPVIIKLPHPANENGEFYFSTSPNFEDACVTEIKKGDEECIIKNPVPGTVVYSKAVIGGKTVVSKSTYIDGQVRMICLPSVWNVRDMGGWKGISGKKIQYGLLYRGGEFDFQEEHNITDEDVKEMKRIGISADVDLRGLGESHENASALGNDVDYIFKNHNRYDQMALKVDANKWKEEFEFIVKNLRQGKSVYIHCIMGADRTGLECFLLGGLLGMDLDQLAKDYELTSMAGKSYSRKISNLSSVFDAINQKQGKTFTDRFYNYYFIDLNVSNKDIRDFRKIMLEGYDAYVNATDIEDLYVEDNPDVDNNIYDLCGRIIDKPSKGIYIRNGRKYIAK